MESAFACAICPFPSLVDASRVYARLVLCVGGARLARGLSVADFVIAASLAATRAPVTLEERDELAALLVAMSMPHGPIAELNTRS